MKQKLNCILLVDDDPATNFLHKRVIQKEDCAEKIATVENGEQALQYLQSLVAENLPAPELIFLDINMPIMNAWEFLEAYHLLPEAQKNKTVIVMLTTSLNPDDELHAAKFPDISAYHFKPLDKNILQEILEKNFAALM